MQRVERFPGPAGRRPPEQVRDRQAEVDLRRGTDIAREEREITFAVNSERWLAARQISSSRACTDAIRARNHVLPHWSDWPRCATCDPPTSMTGSRC